MMMIDDINIAITVEAAAVGQVAAGGEGETPTDNVAFRRQISFSASISSFLSFKFLYHFPSLSSPSKRAIHTLALALTEPPAQSELESRPSGTGSEAGFDHRCHSVFSGSTTASNPDP